VSVDVAGRASSASGQGIRLAIQWLAAVIERRDLSLAAPEGSHGLVLGKLLDALSQEFVGYRSVVAGARDAGRRNRDQLAAIVRTTTEQGALVRTTAAAAREAGDGASLMADAAEALRGFAQAAAGSAAEAGGKLTSIDAALGELQKRLAEGNGPLAEMRLSTAGIADFMVTLARLSRNAQLLAVNASIEAAHLAEAGSRFAIVAAEVRKLSVSTRESKVGVSHIVAELRASTGQVAAATGDSAAATGAAAGEIGGARESLARTGRGIGEFEQLVATVVDVTGTQSMALDAIRTSVDHIAQHADEAAVASREAARLELDVLLERAQAKAERWTLCRTSRQAAPAGGEFAGWIDAIVAGADPAMRHAVDDDANLRPLVVAVRALLERVNAEQREVLADVVAVAVAASRNGYAWRSIAQSLNGLSQETQLVRETVAESANGARSSVELAAGMRALVDSIRSQYD